MPDNFEAVDKKISEATFDIIKNKVYVSLEGKPAITLKHFIHTQITEALIAQNNKHQLLVLEAEREAFKKGFLKGNVELYKQGRLDALADEALKNQSL